MKRTVFLHRAVMLLALCACSGDGAEGTPVEGTDEPQPTPTVSPEGGTTITEGLGVAFSLGMDTMIGLEEVYLLPSETEDGTIEYLDADGDVAAMWEMLPAPDWDDYMVIHPGDTDKWGFDWELYPRERYINSEIASAEEADIVLYVYLNAPPEITPCLGYYRADTKVCTWMQSSEAGNCFVKLTVKSSGSIHLAAKHNGNEPAMLSVTFKTQPID